MTWQRQLAEAFDDPAGRLLGLEVEESEQVVVARLTFSADDLRGEPYEARARIFLPPGLLAWRDERLPVWFNCGYALPDHLALPHVLHGRIVVTSCDPEPGEVFPHPNPLCRGPNTDYVLAHLVRGLRFVDPAAIVYSGGSAGGYAALMVAAEAFPAAAAVPNVPPVNLAYQSAVTAYNAPRIAAAPPEDHPLMALLMGMFVPFQEQGWDRAFGRDVAAPAYLEHSPVAHVERITCPVAACFSTADFLVPIAQVGQEVAAETLANLPDGVVWAASELTASPAAQVRLLDVLGDDVEVHVVPVPEGAEETSLNDVDLTMARPQAQLAVPPRAAKRWLVVVVDEGPSVFGIGHTRHGFQPDYEAFATDALARGIGIDQLTAPKLDQLLGRWSGREWLAAGFRHLDREAAERADVERGLRTYCSTSPAHSTRFAALYGEVPDNAKVLPDQLVRELTGVAPLSAGPGSQSPPARPTRRAP